MFWYVFVKLEIRNLVPDPNLPDPNLQKSSERKAKSLEPFVLTKVHHCWVG
jgi:hypothetical protein